MSSMNGDRIRVDVPASGPRAERVERAVFAELRGAARPDAIAPRSRSRAVWAIAAAACVAAAVVAIVVVGRAPPPQPEVAGPSLVETPIGGGSRFTVGDAVILAGGDTSVAVNAAGDSIVLSLGRGTIDCEVAPRHGRPPFAVIAGDVRVEVVGTRFAVTRAGAGARVDVTHGKVRVRTPSGERYLTAGESWTPSEIAAAPTVPATPVEPIEIEPSAPPESVPTPAPQPSSREMFKAAQLVEASDPKKAARLYREIASGRDSWAALALYNLAELIATSDPHESMRALDELARRFPNGANAEDAAWLRVDVLRRSGRTDEARVAARSYLARFPRGTYATPAAQVASPR